MNMQRQTPTRVETKGMFYNVFARTRQYTYNSPLSQNLRPDHTRLAVSPNALIVKRR